MERTLPVVRVRSESLALAITGLGCTRKVQRDCTQLPPPMECTRPLTTTESSDKPTDLATAWLAEPVVVVAYTVQLLLAMACSVLKILADTVFMESRQVPTVLELWGLLTTQAVLGAPFTTTPLETLCLSTSKAEATRRFSRAMSTSTVTFPKLAGHSKSITRSIRPINTYITRSSSRPT